MLANNYSALKELNRCRYEEMDAFYDILWLYETENCPGLDDNTDKTVVELAIEWAKESNRKLWSRYTMNRARRSELGQLAHESPTEPIDE